MSELQALQQALQQLQKRRHEGGMAADELQQLVQRAEQLEQRWSRRSLGARGTLAGASNALLRHQAEVLSRGLCVGAFEFDAEFDDELRKGIAEQADALLCPSTIEVLNRLLKAHRAEAVSQRTRLKTLQAEAMRLGALNDLLEALEDLLGQLSQPVDVVIEGVADAVESDV